MTGPVDRPRGAGQPTTRWRPGPLDALPLSDILALTEDYPEITRTGRLTPRAARILADIPGFTDYPVGGSARAPRP